VIDIDAKSVSLFWLGFSLLVNSFVLLNFALALPNSESKACSFYPPVIV
jgi:hypothetical protein